MNTMWFLLYSSRHCVEQIEFVFIWMMDCIYEGGRSTYGKLGRDKSGRLFFSDYLLFIYFFFGINI